MFTKILLVLIASQVAFRPGYNIISDARGVGAVKNLVDSEVTEELRLSENTIERIRKIRSSVFGWESEIPPIENGKVKSHEEIVAIVDARVEPELEAVLRTLQQEGRTSQRPGRFFLLKLDHRPPRKARRTHLPTLPRMRRQPNHGYMRGRVR